MIAEPRKNGLRVVGLVFLALGLFKLLTGGAWVVWVILGFLFGGLSGLGGKKGADQE